MYIERKTFKMEEDKWLLKFWGKLNFLIPSSLPLFPLTLLFGLKFLPKGLLYFLGTLKSLSKNGNTSRDNQGQQGCSPSTGSWMHTCTNAIEKASSQDHLKGLGCFTEGHEKCSYQHDQVGEHLALFSETNKQTNPKHENLGWNENLLYSLD